MREGLSSKQFFHLRIYKREVLYVMHHQAVAISLNTLKHQMYMSSR